MATFKCFSTQISSGLTAYLTFPSGCLQSISGITYLKQSSWSPPNSVPKSSLAPQAPLFRTVALKSPWHLPSPNNLNIIHLQNSISSFFQGCPDSSHCITPTTISYLACCNHFLRATQLLHPCLVTSNASGDMVLEDYNSDHDTSAQKTSRTYYYT